MIEHLEWLIGRICCALFNIENVTCCGNQRCWVKYHGDRP